MSVIRARYTVTRQSWSDGAWADLAASASGALITQPEGGVASGAADSGNPIKVAGKYNSTVPTFSNGQRGDLQIDANGALRARVTGGQASGGDALANTVIYATAADNNNALHPLVVAPVTHNGAGYDRSRKPNGTSRIASAAASVNATSAKASAGDVHRIFGNNAKASIVYLKLYNKATAPTVGTDTPVITIPIAASSVFNFDLSGHYFSTGIAYGFTTDAADNGTTALSAGDILDFTLTYA